MVNEQNGSLAAQKPNKLNRMYKSVNNIIDYAERHDLGGLISINLDLHKAHAGERITTPHLNPDLWEIEKQFFALQDPMKVISEILTGIGITDHPSIVKSSYGDFSLQKAIKNKIQKINGEALTEKEFNALKDLIMKALDVPASKVEALILKAAAVAKVSNIDFMGKPVKIDLKGLPTNLKAAIARGSFTVQEVRALKYAFQYAAINITSVTSRAQARISNMVIESIQNKEHPHRLASRMFDEMAIGDDAVLNRDWERIAITETNRSANDAIIAGHADGEYVLGNSHVDACQYCMRYIDKKVYKVTTHPPENPSNYKPGSSKYIELANRWDTEIWVGKSNMGRSLAAKRRTPKGLVPRKHHELGTPVIPLHPTCRCRWSTWLPELYYLKNGRVEFAVDEKSRAEQAEFLKKNPHILKGATT